MKAGLAWLLRLHGRRRAQRVAEAYRQRDAMHQVHVDPPTIPWRAPATRASLQLGEHELALELAAEQLDVARKWGAATEVGAALRLLAHASPDARLELLTESVSVLESSPSRLELARSLVDLGLSGSRRRRSSQATRLE